MYGKIRINVKEIDNEASAVEIHTDLEDASAEEVLNIIHGLADSFHLLGKPEYAGVLAMSILTNKPAYQLADELSPERLVLMGRALYGTANDVAEEITERNKKQEKDSFLKRMVDKLFED